MKQIQNTAELRGFNRKKIINYLRKRPLVTKRDLAAELDLSYPTVSTICNELVEMGILEQRGPDDPAGGRAPQLLALNGGTCLVGVLNLLRPEQFEVSLVNLCGQVLDTVLVEAGRSKTLENNIEALFTAFTQVLQKNNHNFTDVIGLGVAAPGIYNKSNGLLVNSTNQLFEGRPLKRLLADRFLLPVFVEKESNLLVTAASLSDEAQHDVIYLFIDEGLGVGIMSGGRLVTGTSGFGGEIEHLRLGSRGYQCYCGHQNCIEQELSRGGFLRKWAEELSQMPGAFELNWEAFMAAFARRDAAALRVIEENGRLLGELVSVLVNLFDPALVYVGGIVAQMFDGLEAPARAEIKARLVAAAERPVQLEADRDFRTLIAAGSVELVFREWQL